MIKRTLFMGALAAMLLGTASCSNDLEPVAPDGEANVHFTLVMGEGVDSRTISDGTGADVLMFAVFDENGNHMAALDQEVTVTNKTATVNTKLARYHTYKLVFWAQNSNCEAYTFDADAKKLEIDYTGIKSNDETRDAFYKEIDVAMQNTDIDQQVVLSRPFAQINFLASDAAGVSGIASYKSKVTVTDVPATLNLLDGTVADPEDVTFDYETIVSEALAGYEDYKYVAMNYILAASERELKNTVELTVNDGTQDVQVVPVTSCPVLRNYRTNIIGELFTIDGTFNVVVDPIYGGDVKPEVSDGKAMVGMNGTEYNTLAEAIAAADGMPIYLGKGTYNESITVPAGETVRIAGAANADPSEVIIPKQIVASTGSTLQLTDLTVTMTNAAAISAEGANVTLDGVNASGSRGISVEDGSTVVIKNSVITGATSDSEGYNRGLSVFGSDNVVTVEDSEINAGWYGVNTAGGDNNEITLNNVTINAWGCLNIWRNGQTITLNNCTLNSLNDKTYNADGWNNFACLKFNNDTNGNTVTANGCEINVESTTGNKQYLCLIGGTDQVINVVGCTVTGTNTNTGEYMFGLGQSGATYTINYDEDSENNTHWNE